MHGHLQACSRTRKMAPSTIYGVVNRQLPSIQARIGQAVHDLKPSEATITPFEAEPSKNLTQPCTHNTSASTPPIPSKASPTPPKASAPTLASNALPPHLGSPSVTIRFAEVVPLAHNSRPASVCGEGPSQQLMSTAQADRGPRRRQWGSPGTGVSSKDMDSSGNLLSS